VIPYDRVLALFVQVLRNGSEGSGSIAIRVNYRLTDVEPSLMFNICDGASIQVVGGFRHALTLGLNNKADDAVLE